MQNEQNEQSQNRDTGLNGNGFRIVYDGMHLAEHFDTRAECHARYVELQELYPNYGDANPIRRSNAQIDANCYCRIGMNSSCGCGAL